MTTSDPESEAALSSIHQLVTDLRAAQQGVIDAFTRVRKVKSRIAAVKKTLREAMARKPRKTSKPRAPRQALAGATPKRRGLPKLQPKTEPA